ncbi:DUF5992 family protein [Aliikangiella sp. IMCC44359]|uniref:DUF5992 family protein n=1 Tax=Aliikangiella sp. IMCC44359 TaxID=3459125 RepID=UPI00403AC3B3
MLKKLISLTLLCSSATCISGELIKGATVLEVASNGSNAKNFAVLIEGGTGACASTLPKWIYFPQKKAPSLESYNQSFTLALSALNSDKKVRIHNYKDNSCSGADYISVSR